jgi:oligoribonuclease
MAKDSDNLIWIDLEMTGLRPDVDYIIEIATLVTDRQLNVLAEGPSMVIHQPEEVLALMDDWNRRQHGASGLVTRVRSSNVTASHAEQLTLLFLSNYLDPGVSPMCGNSICQDRRFLARHMPNLEKFFHYRNLDVSTIKELARRWAPDVAPLDKTSAHLAMDDIRESVKELVYYRQRLFAPPYASPPLSKGS